MLIGGDSWVLVEQSSCTLATTCHVKMLSCITCISFTGRLQVPDLQCISALLCLSCDNRDFECLLIGLVYPQTNEMLLCH